MKNSLLTFGLILSISTSCFQPVETESIRKDKDGGSGESNNATGGNGPGTGGSTGSTGPTNEVFEEFLSLVRSEETPTCLDCHNTPDKLKGPGIQGPLEIFDYGHMLEKLGEGDFANDNYLYNKLTGKIAHTGDVICRNEDDPLCAKLLQWWISEFGDGVGDVSLGKIYEVTTTGLIKGIATDKDKPDTIYQVRIYRQDGNETPVLLGEGSADQGTLVGNQFSSRAFTIQIPLNMVDGQKHTIQAFAIDGGEEVKLGSAFEYTAYRPLGQNNANNFGNIGIANNCTGCHANGFPYQNLWTSLAFPAPNKGGTATNNFLYQISVPGTPRATGHSGGAVGNSNAIRAWWCEEFDPQGATAECP